MVVTFDSTIEAKPLPTGTFAQKAELIAHLQALQLAAGVRVSTLTPSTPLVLSMYTGPYTERKG